MVCGNMLSLTYHIRSTANFSVDEKLGEGGFGQVFRGTILDSMNRRTVFFAVKLMSSRFSIDDGSR